MVNKVVTEEEANVALSEVTMSKPELSKVRFLAGWVLFKERAAAKAAADKGMGSTSRKVQEKAKQETRFARLLNDMIISRDEAIRKTKYPETLDHIEVHNRGALAHVSDVVFNFFVKLEKCCKKTFTNGIIEKYQSDGLKVARQLVKEELSLNLAWHDVIEQTIAAQQCEYQDSYCGTSFAKKCLNSE